MKNATIISGLGMTILCFLFSCKDSHEHPPEPYLSAAEIFQDYFTLGASLSVKQIQGTDSLASNLIETEFNSIVPENCMKSEAIHPSEAEFFWEDADAFVELGMSQKKEIIGHALFWHSQCPPWLFVDDNGNHVSREVLLERMKIHAHTIMKRYDGKVDGWDVVNEAVLDDGTMRKSPFYEIIGEDWVEQAFSIAQSAQTDAELYYNDYSTAIPEKREGIYNLVRQIQSKGIRVDGIGMQGHVNINSDDPSIDNLEKTIQRFSELGTVMITELDITVLPWPDLSKAAEISLNAEYKEEYNPYPDGLPEDVSFKLHNRYMELFNLFIKHSADITRVTFWGVYDGQSWRNYWPITGRTDYPLAFDRKYNRKAFIDSLHTSLNQPTI